MNAKAQVAVRRARVMMSRRVLAFWFIALLQLLSADIAPLSAHGSNDAALTKPRLTVEILSPQDGATVTKPQVQLQVLVRTVPGAVVSLYPLVDGKRLAKTRGFVVGPPPPGAAKSLTETETVQTIDIPIPRANCAVAVIAESAPGTHTSSAVRLNWHAEDGFVIKPKLYLLAVGISSYKEGDLTLRYGSKDAADFARAFATQQGGLYEQVQTRTLLDGQATRDNILDGLQWLQRQTTANDVAILFLAGHGIDDPSSGVYYFLPHEADPSAILRTMISQQSLQTALHSIAGKALLFLDTCHAASVMNGAAGRAVSDVSRLVQELSRIDNGLLVYAAASGRQLSQESPSWGNGAFTKAAIEGILGRAAYHPGRPITAQMLNLYISERVKELTAGVQTPIMITPNNMADFPLALMATRPTDKLLTANVPSSSGLAPLKQPAEKPAGGPPGAAAFKMGEQRVVMVDSLLRHEEDNPASSNRLEKHTDVYDHQGAYADGFTVIGASTVVQRELPPADTDAEAARRSGIWVRIVSAPIPGQVGKAGYLYGDSLRPLGTNPPHFRAPDVELRWSSNLWSQPNATIREKVLPAHLKLRILYCQGQTAKVEGWQADGEYLWGFIRLTQFGENPCGRSMLQPPAIKSDSESAAEPARTPSDMFVVVQNAWNCPTPEAAHKGTRCAGGEPLLYNSRVHVRGILRADGVLPILSKTSQGYIHLSSLNELPGEQNLSQFRAELGTAIPEQLRIPPQQINYSAFLDQGDALRKRKLVMNFHSTWMRELHYQGDVFSFVIEMYFDADGTIPNSLVRFELRNARYVKEVHSGSKTYTCGDLYCDELTMVAQLTTRVMNSGDPAEPLSRMPVFQIETLADIQGVYKADGGK